MEGRWRVILGVLMIQVVGGALYIWSRFAGPLNAAYGFTPNQFIWIYVVTIAFFSIGLSISARLLTAKGPKTTAFIGALFLGGGIMLASFTSTLVPMALCYGVIAGLGSGIMYLVPLTTLIHWFPKNRGLANGICIMAFGFSTLIFIPVANLLLGTVPATPAIMKQTFMTMGAIYLVVAFIGSRLMVLPAGHAGKVVVETENDIQPIEAVKSIQFWLVFGTLLFGCIPGIFLISSAAPLGEAMVSLTLSQVSVLVMALGVINAFGRLVSGWLGDKLGAIRAYRIILLISVVSVGLIAFVPITMVTFLIAFTGIVIGFGGTVALSTTSTLTLFGPKYYGTNVAYVVLAYGASAITAIMIKLYARLELTQVFTVAFIASAIALVFALLLRPYRKKEKQMETN